MATKKGARRVEQKDVYIQMKVPADLHTQVKTHASAQRLTLKEYVLETLRKSVEKGGKKD
jgi:predicted DNA binding CopG/RHH family protein